MLQDLQCFIPSSHEAPSPLIRRWLKFVAASLQDPPCYRLHYCASCNLFLRHNASCNIFLWHNASNLEILHSVLLAIYNVLLHSLLVPSAIVTQHHSSNSTLLHILMLLLHPIFPHLIYCIKTFCFSQNAGPISALFYGTNDIVYSLHLCIPLTVQQ